MPALQPGRLLGGVSAGVSHTIYTRPPLISAPPNPQIAGKGTTVRSMVEVSIEACRGAARHRVTVRAESIERGIDVVKRHLGAEEARVLFPIDPDAFFASGPPEYFIRAGDLEATE